jgi:hypothetical protein
MPLKPFIIILFGMVFGVGIDLLKLRFLGCLILPAPRKRLLRIMWNDLMVPSNRISTLRGSFMIGRWRFWLRFIGACILVS